MRLHILALQAFGPYADRQEVDFEELNAAGVFLLTGPTGAGKTSLLDAVCFALYGVVPGERQVRGLRSDHAATTVAPLVELELTLCGRRLRIERSPEWQRPKRRGEGTTTERARAKLFEIVGEEERLLSDRLQEIGHELGPLLGMSAEQFQQVVLLPQGGFSTFLHAASDDRRAVLEKLFATQRFGRIESWVHERAGQLRRRAEEHEAEVLRLLATMADRAGCPTPDDVASVAIGSWRTDVLEQARAAVEAATRAEAAAGRRAARAQDHYREVGAAHAAARRRDAAQDALTALAATEAAAQEAASRLGDHRRAAGVVPLLAALDEAEQRLARARQEAELATAPLSGPVDREACEAEVVVLTQRLGELQALGPVVSRLQDASRRRELLSAELAETTRVLDGLAEASTSLPAELHRIERRLEESRAAVSRRADSERALREAVERREASEALPAARAEVQSMDARAREAHQLANESRAAHLDLVERRLRGMAGELAGELTEGAGCQVCGSTDHPDPAPAEPDAVTREEQQQAADTADRARSLHEQAQQELAAARQRLALLERASGGLDVEAARAAEAEATRAVAQVEQAESDATGLVDRAEDLRARIRDAAEGLERARAAREELAQQLAVADEVVAQTEPQVEAALGSGVSLERAVAATTEETEAVRRAARALTDLDDAVHHLAESRRRVEAAATAAGFDSPEAVRTAGLDPEEEAAAERVLESRRDTRARAAGVLDEPEVRALGASGLPHSDDALAAARTGAESSARVHTEAVSDLRAAGDRHIALLSLDDQLEAAVAAWQPAQSEHDLADSMSRLVRGTGGDNQLQMRLSSYVLATRLDQVLEAANERLLRMRDSRYTFRRTVGAPAARGRSGLDIEVLDEWTGEARSPSTLSGGETFTLSLALALGLADVITHESGGLDIETLFIDEGFGMLDADTLDDVMDCIDDLRSGGRAVGVVSHVTELRGRISTQLQVTASRDGSAVSLTTSVA
jgi:exonuclease SbcC